jgi:hypothetical protein
MKRYLALLPLALLPLLAASLAACQKGGEAGGQDGGEDGPGGSADAAPASACAPADPERYDDTRYQSNAIVELGLRAAQDAFMMPMREAGADATLKPTAARLRALFDQGPPSLRSITTPYYAGQVDAWLDLFEASAGNSWTPAEPPPATGGKLGVDIFSPQGLDIRQAIDKGMFSASFYNRAVALMNGTVTAATVDRILALYGTHPSFSMGDAGAGSADVGAAVYAKRRTDPAAATPGVYRRIKRDLVAAQAAAAMGAACATELGDALRRIRDDWERTLLATTVYYANDAKTRLGRLEVAGALHSLGEGLGFVHGFRMMPAENRTITDAQIDEILGLIGAPPGGPVTLYRFATDTAAQAPRLDEVIARVQMVYRWSDAEVASFKTAF